MPKPTQTTTTTSTTANTSLLSTNATAASIWQESNASFWDPIRLSIKAICALEAILIIAANLFLLAVILSSQKVRGKLRNHLVLSLVVANLVVGVFSSPFTVDYAIQREWVHGCFFHVVSILLTVDVQNFVSLWNVVLLLLHYLFRLLQYDGPAFLLRLPAILRRAVPAVFVASPWIVAMILVVPLVFGGLHRDVWVWWSDTECPLVLELWAIYVLNVVSYVLPALAILVLIVAVMVVYRRRRAVFGEGALKKMEMGSSLVGEEDDELEGPAVHVVTGLLAVLLMTPEHLSQIVRFHKVFPWKDAMVVGVVAMLLGEFLPFLMVLPLLLMLPDVRMRMVELFSLIPALPFRRSPPQSTETSAQPVSFRDLTDE